MGKQEKTNRFSNKFEVNEFIDSIVESLNDSKLSLFTGAGASISAGMPTWKGLFSSLLERNKIKAHANCNFYDLLQYLHNTVVDKTTILNYISQELSIISKDDSMQKAMYELNADSFWTTNWDEVYSQFLKNQEQIIPRLVTKDSMLSNSDVIKQKTIYHMNGCIRDFDSLVVTKNDFDNYNHTHEGMLVFLKRELITNTFLFIGYSFQDHLILSTIKAIKKFNKNTKHYAILFNDENNPNFKHFISNLEKTYGIYSYVLNGKKCNEKECVWNQCKRKECNQKNTKQVVDILDLLKHKINNQQIYISGSYRNFDNKQKDEVVKLSHALIDGVYSEKKYIYRIANSLGAGLCQRIIGGAAEYIRKNNEKIDRRLVIHHGDFDTRTQSGTQKLREKLMFDSGIALFMYGKDNNSTRSNGVRQEFEVAKKLGLKIIPLGVTGYETKEIWKEVKNNITKYPYLENCIDKLDTEKDPEKLTKIVVEIINNINDNKY